MDQPEQRKDESTFECPTVLDLPKGFFQSHERAISLKDIRLLAELPIWIAIGWSCSDAQCLKLARAVAQRLHRRRPRRYEEFEQIFRDFLPEGHQYEAASIQAIEAAALMHFERLQLLRYHRPGSWRPKISIAGKQHIDDALSRGKGAILWVTHAVFSDMISKVALREQGYDVWHLSRHIHGHFSETDFGIRFLNPIRIAIERRYLADRVVIDPADPKAASFRLEQLLADNRVVSITVGPMARRVTLAPFGPGYLPLAGGAPSLALRSGAPLLPVFTERRDDGSFLVTVEPPLDAGTSSDRAQSVSGMVVREAGLLRRYFERLPTQFLYPDLHHVRGRCETLLEERPDAGPAAG